jgi:hypothetical protein
MRDSTPLRKVKIKMNHTKTWVPSGDSDGLVCSVLLLTPVVILFFRGVRDTRSLDLRVDFVDSCLSFFYWLSLFVYRFCLPHWYLQILLKRHKHHLILKVNLLEPLSYGCIEKSMFYSNPLLCIQSSLYIHYIQMKL